MDEVVLKAFRQERTVKIQLAENEEPRDFKVITITGAEKARWKDGQIKNTRLDANNNPVGVKTFSRLEAGLISLCLRDDADQPVGVDVIDNWPTPLLEALTKICLDHNGLTKQAEDEKK